MGPRIPPRISPTQQSAHAFPDRPIAAFTASATQHVRHDIIEQLKLRDPDKYIASFHRPNLNYIVRRCDADTQIPQLVDAIRAHPDGSIIVYSPTIDRVKETMDILKANGIDAIGYHGKMEAPTRAAIRKPGCPAMSA